ncbi:MAG: 2-dehydropantoate 2-reductase [Spirochaetia bacterium]|nr:2-dehydropantoate 2-reductase [Spirochaetia bacterium]
MALNKTKTYELKSVAVIGAGAVGSFYGAKLQSYGLKVQYQSKTSASALKRKKLKIKSIWGDFSLKAQCFESTNEMTPADLILVSSKVLPEIDLSKNIKPLLHKNSVIMLMQNGINEEEKLAKKIKNNSILGALAFTCIHRIKPHIINHLDYGLIRIGAVRKKDAKTAEYIAEIFNKAGIKADSYFPLRQIRWQKLLWNVPFNALSVALGSVDTKKMTSNADALSLVKQMMKEVQAIARADKIKIPDSDIAAMIARTNKMAPYKTSMLLDFENKNPMEIETILGEPLKIARAKNVNAPVMQTIYHLLKTLEDKK